MSSFFLHNFIYTRIVHSSYLQIDVNIYATYIYLPTIYRMQLISVGISHIRDIRLREINGRRPLSISTPRNMRIVAGCTAPK